MTISVLIHLYSQNSSGIYYFSPFKINHFLDILAGLLNSSINFYPNIRELFRPRISCLVSIPR